MSEETLTHPAYEPSHAVDATTVSDVLKWIGWTNLVLGVLLGLWLLMKGLPPSPVADPNPIMIGFGVALLAQGLIGSALIFGFASIVENVAAIRRRLVD